MLDTLVNVKSRLGITTDAYDAFLTNQITLVSDVIEDYCRRKFAEGTWEQTFYRNENRSAQEITLFHFPVSTITSIEEDGVAVDAGEYRIHKPSGIIRSSQGRSFFNAVETVITYDAGYDPIPSAILAVLDNVVGERYNRKSSGVALDFGSDVQRISIPGAISIDFDYTLKNNERSSAYGSILGDNANILDDWRSERAVLNDPVLKYVEESP